jgi:hypothetical protein
MGTVYLSFLKDLELKNAFSISPFSPNYLYPWINGKQCILQVLIVLTCKLLQTSIINDNNATARYRWLCTYPQGIVEQ